MDITKYLNRQHDYQNLNCVSLLCEFYEKELNIDCTEEKLIFNNFKITSLKDLFKIPVDKIYTLKNWQKVNLTDLKKYDIIIYCINNKLSHFSMYIGNYKVLTLHENEKSALRHLNDVVRNKIESVIRHKQLVT